MTDESRKPIRAQLDEKLRALSALHAMGYLHAHASAAAPGATVTADYQMVLAQLERESLQAIAAAAGELRKPTVSDLVDRLWSAGPLTFEQIQAAIAESGAPAGEVETLLNRLRNAGLLEGAAGPPTDRVAFQAEQTLPPTRLEPEVTRRISIEPEAPTDSKADDDVTATHSQLVKGSGRDWFNARALAQGIDLSERINCQF